MEELLIPYRAVNRIDGERILVFAPHPDDEIFGCGGALLRHVDARKAVQVVIVTDGGHGVADEERATCVAQRREESRQAARIVGYDEPMFLGYLDRGLMYGEKLVLECLDLIERLRCDLVYAPSLLEIHPDHRALAMAVTEAVRRIGAGLCLAYYEVGMPLRPNVLLDIGAQAERKMSAMRCFVSQNVRQRYDLDIAALNRYRSYTLPPDVVAAEAFVLTRAEDLAADPLGLYCSEHARQKQIGLPLDNRDAPLVSVIIRSMDRPTLGDALDSVALQTYPNVEVVLVNAKGVGHRAFGEWCGRFPLRMVDLGEPAGRSRAANVGLSHARGHLMIFLDDDDWFEPDHLVTLASLLHDSPRRIAAYSGIRCVTASGQQMAKRYERPFDAALLYAGNYIPLHAVLFSRRAIDAGCRFDEHFDVFEDWDFWLQVSRHGDFVFSGKTSAAYRIHGDSGWGVTFDPEVARLGTIAILSKWRREWRDEDFFAWAKLTQRLDSEKEIIENERQKVEHELQRVDQERRRWEAEAVQRGEWFEKADQARGAWEAEALKRGEWALSLKTDGEQKQAEIRTLFDSLHAKQQELERSCATTEYWRGEFMRVQAQTEANHQRLLLAETTLIAMRSSISWRVGAPLRYARQGMRALFPSLKSVVRGCWRHLPLTEDQRCAVREFALSHFGLVLRGTAVYRHWLARREYVRTLLERRLDFFAQTAASASPGMRGEIPEIAAIVRVRTLDAAYRSLSTLLERRGARSLEVIVVDDGSADETSLFLENSVSGVRVVRNDHGPGRARAFNLGARLARAQVLFFLDAGLEIAQNCFDEVLAMFDVGHAAAAVGIPLISTEGNLLEAGGEIGPDAVLCPHGAGMNLADPQYAFVSPVAYSSVLALSQEEFGAVGGFDESLDACSFAELGLRLGMSGHPVLLQPATHVLRFENDAESDVMTERTCLSARYGAVLAERPAPLRKHFLVLDMHTPTPDKDSGSVDAFCHMRILVELGYSVTFIPVATLEHQGRYTQDLQRIGVECLYAPWISSVEAHLAEHGARYAYVMMSRVDTATHYLEMVAKYCYQAKLIFNTVDLHFLRERRKAELEGSAEALRAAAALQDRELGIVEMADCTILISRAEEEIVRAEAPGARLFNLPLVMDVRDQKETPFAARRDMFLIGGFCHLPNVDAACYLVSDIWPLIRARLPGVRLFIVGSHPPPEVLALAGDDVVVTGYVEDVSGFFNDCRLSLAPLRYGAGLKGKIGRSLAYGLPAVASPIAVEGTGLIDGEHILVAGEIREFADAVVRLYQDESLWAHLAQRSTEFFREHYSYEAGMRRMAMMLSLLTENLGSENGLALVELKGMQQYLDYRENNSGEYARRLAIEKLLVGSADQFAIRGRCQVCGKASEFHGNYMHALADADGRPVPNLREHLACPGCGLNNRMRASIHLFEQLCTPRADAAIYLTEQITPLFEWFAGHYSNAVGSEYLGSAVAGGACDSRGVRNEDLTALSFAAASFDCILSFDVLEHIPNYRQALRECFRCLKEGGVFLFSVPFACHSERNIVRALLTADGRIEHLLPPEYHGNPSGATDCLCYYHFGWELLDELRACGFAEVRAELFWSRTFGYLGGEQILFYARKAPLPS